MTILPSRLALCLALLTCSACHNFFPKAHRALPMPEPVVVPSAEPPIQIPKPPKTPERDPFRSALRLPSEIAKPKPSSEAIFRFEIQDFKVVGAIFGQKATLALVEDPLGDVHVVREGSLIGKEQGRIRHIGVDSIEIIEKNSHANSLPVKVILKNGGRRRADNISIHMDNVDLRDAISVISETAHTDIKIPDGIGGKIGIHLEDVSWRNALKEILHKRGLHYTEDNGSILLKDR